MECSPNLGSIDPLPIFLPSLWSHGLSGAAWWLVRKIRRWVDPSGDCVVAPCSCLCSTFTVISVLAGIKWLYDRVCQQNWSRMFLMRYLACFYLVKPRFKIICPFLRNYSMVTWGQKHCFEPQCQLCWPWEPCPACSGLWGSCCCQVSKRFS
jgi:hypothetical protein